MFLRDVFTAIVVVFAQAPEYWVWRESLFDFSAICAEDIWIFRTSEIFVSFTRIRKFTKPQ